MTGSTWNAYHGRMTTPLLRCAPLATPRGRCHGIHEEHLKRGAGNGSPFPFFTHDFAAFPKNHGWRKDCLLWMRHPPHHRLLAFLSAEIWYCSMVAPMPMRPPCCGTARVMVPRHRMRAGLPTTSTGRSSSISIAVPTVHAADAKKNSPPPLTSRVSTLSSGRTALLRDAQGLTRQGSFRSYRRKRL